MTDGMEIPTPEIPRPVWEVIDRCGEGIVSIDGEWRIAFVNRRAAEIFRAAPGDLLGRCAWELAPDPVDRSFYDACHSAVRDQLVLRHELYIEAWNCWLQGQLYPSKLGLTILFQDVTDSKTTEAELRKSRDHLRALTAHLQSLREEEATRTARMLHGELGSALTGLKLDLGWIARRVSKLGPEEEAALVNQRARSSTELLDATIANVRKMCRDLRPPLLDQVGLVAALESLLVDFEGRNGIRSAFECPERVEVDYPAGINLFRICQEALANIARHSGADFVRICLLQNDITVSLEITDNGRGLPPEALSSRDHFGLTIIQERATASGGAATFESNPGQGTTIRVELPFRIKNVSYE